MDNRAAFEQFHKQNPQIFDLFRRFAEHVRKNGHKHYSAKAIFERIRWHVHVETNDPEFKINNNYTAYYARLLEDKEPRFVGFFRNRKIRG